MGAFRAVTIGGWCVRRPRTALALGLLAVAVAAIGPGLLPGRTPMPLDLLGLFAPWRSSWPPPRNPLLGDVVLHVADRLSIARAWRSGHLPLWAPEIMAGHPMAGDSSMQPFFPLHVLPAALFGVQIAFAIQLVLQLWLAGLAMAAWVRSLTRGWLPAVAAALVWMLAAYQQYWRSYPQFLGTLLWLPLAAAAWERAALSGSRRWAALGGAAVGLTVLGGQMQFAAFGAILLAAYGAGRLATFERTRRRSGVRAAILIASLGFALGAIGLLPAAELARESIRGPFDRHALVATGVPLRQLVTALAPWFLGDPRAGSYRGAQNANEMALYVGALPLLLALATPWARRDRTTRLVAALGASIAVIALGTPAAWPVAALPYLRQFGLMRWLAMWPLVAALLGGLGLDGVRRADAASDPVVGRRLRRSAGALSAAAVIVLVVGAARAGLPVTAWATAVAWIAASFAVLAVWTHRPGAWARSFAVVGCILLDLWTFAHGYTPDAPRASHFPRLAPLDRFARAADVSHTADIADSGPTAAADAGRVAVLQQGRSIVLGPQVAPAVGLIEIGGYSSAVRASYRTFLARLSDASDDPYLNRNGNMLVLAGLRPILAQLLDVRYVLASEPLGAIVRTATLPVSASDGIDLCASTTTLAPGRRLTATFVADAEGLNRIDVALAPTVGGALGGPIAVHVFRAGDDSEHLAYGEVGSSGDAVPPDRSEPAFIEWRTLYFDPIAGSRGRRFAVAVDVPAGGAGAAPAEGAPGAPRLCTPGDRLTFRAWGRATPLPATRVASANGVDVYRTDTALGRAWWVPEAVTATSQDDALDRVTAPGFDPRQVVVVETTGLDMAGPATRDAAAGPGPAGVGDPHGVDPHADARDVRDAGDGWETPWPVSIEVVDDGPNTLRVRLPRRSDPGWLVLAEPYAPGWHADVDAAPAAVVRADGGVRAVAVPAGARDVRLWYLPASVKWGLSLGALGWFGFVALLLPTRRSPVRRRSRDGGNPSGD